jgi:hypothetical protein
VSPCLKLPGYVLPSSGSSKQKHCNCISLVLSSSIVLSCTALSCPFQWAVQDVSYHSHRSLCV